jgi:hypothetical protein
MDPIAPPGGTPTAPGGGGPIPDIPWVIPAAAGCPCTAEGGGTPPLPSNGTIIVAMPDVVAVVVSEEPKLCTIRSSYATLTS